jgi:hypothetical protein
MKLNQREMLLIGAIAGLVVLLAAWFAGTAGRDYWRALNRDLQARRRELKGMQDTIACAPRWRQQVEKLRSGMHGQQKKFEHEIEFSNQIEELSKKAGLTISGRQASAVEHGSYRELTVSRSFEATLQNTIHFLYAVQIEAGLITIDELKLNPRNDSPNVLRGDILLRTLADRKRKGAS